LPRGRHDSIERFHQLPVGAPKQIFPGWSAPVVRNAADGEREVSLLTWGFVLLQDGRAPKRVTNTRDDKIKGPFWSESFKQRRCLVPASSFCEPHDGRKPASWHWFALKGSSHGRVLAVADIFETYTRRRARTCHGV
jgi:putative SOS response-associated peptidase YedK